MMSDDDQRYVPVSCEQHSEYELAIIRGQTLLLHWTDENGRRRHERVLPTDMLTRGHAEYLVVRTAGGDNINIRLDAIIGTGLPGKQDQ